MEIIQGINSNRNSGPQFQKNIGSRKFISFNRFWFSVTFNWVQIRLLLNSSSGYSDVDDNVFCDFIMETILRCWWQNYYVGELFGILMRQCKSYSKSCHQYRDCNNFTNDYGFWWFNLKDVLSHVLLFFVL